MNLSMTSTSSPQTDIDKIAASNMSVKAWILVLTQDTKGIKSPSQIPGQSPSLTAVEQDWKHKEPEDLDFSPPA